MKRMGIFGGSFDPPHVEHVALAKRAIAELQLDTLFVMPAHTPPHKREKALTADETRLELCRLAFSGVDGVCVCDYEIAKGGTSYTYETCRHFKEIYPNAQLFWLVGTDMLRDFPTWKNPDEILACATLAVCARAEESGWEEREQAVFEKRFQKNFVTVSYQGRAVSSTQVRVLAGAGEDVRPQVGEKVAAYVEETGLYEIPFAKDALALEKESRKAHSLRVAEFACRYAKKFGVPERQALTAALFHDCAKNLPLDSPLLSGFECLQDVPAPVVHQFAGAYLAKEKFGVSDESVLNAIRYHTSGRENMTAIEKLLYLADMLEDGRSFDGVDELRKALDEKGVDACMKESLFRSLAFVEERGLPVYPLTKRAYEYLKNEGE